MTPFSVQRSEEGEGGPSGGGGGRTAVECAIYLGEVEAWVGHGLEVVDDLIPGWFKVATVATIR